MSDDTRTLDELAVLTAKLQESVERERAIAEKLARQEERFRALLSASFEGLAVSVNGIIVEANEAVARMAGTTREALLGMSVFDLATPESGALVLENIRAGIETPYEITARRIDGTTFPGEVVGRNILYQGKPARVTAFRDITLRKKEEEERRRLEMSMLHAQRLEQLGVLAGGIAHDFNNLALVILGHTELGLAATEDPELRHHLEQVRLATSQASELTKQMLSYAGRTLTARESVDLTMLAREMIGLLGTAVSKRARLALDLEERLVVEGDPGQLRQILMNLVMNASDALGEDPGDIRVSVGTREVAADELSRARVNATAGAGRYVVLEVTDTGCGMDAATQDRMFDPFYTTKFSGRGLGLASVLGIVRSHHGAITVDSAPQKGSRITVFLPLPSASGRVSAPPVARKAHILVVDDQPMIRSLIRQYLQSLGFEVLLAEDGRMALDVFGTRADEIDLVVLDMMMPGMGGAEVLPIFRDRRPDLPVILLSGFFSADLPRAPGDLRTVFLPKPFQTSELAEQVERLLGTSRRDPVL